MTAKISLSKWKHPCSIPSADLCLWTTAPAVSAVNKEKEKRVREESEFGEPSKAQSHSLWHQRAMFSCDIGCRTKPQARKICITGKSSLEKRPEFWKNKVYRVVCKAPQSALKLSMTYRYWLHRMHFLWNLSFIMGHMCNVSRHAISGKAENLKHVCSQGKHGIKKKIFTFFFECTK